MSKFARDARQNVSKDSSATVFASRKVLAAIALVALSAVAAVAAFVPQSLSLQRLLTPVLGAAAPQGQVEVLASQDTEHFALAAPTTSSNLSAGRSGHTATLLADGRVLVVGGSGDTTAETFDPATSTAAATGNTNAARMGHTATRLADGRVLVAGGSGDGSIELYDPANGTFSLGPNMTATRSGHTATTLSNGSLLITGGGTDSAEVFDGTSFTAAGTMTASRTNASAVLMADGRVFIAGGTGSNTAEIYNPADGTFTAAGNAMMLARAKALLRVLPDGKIQIIGGNGDGSMEVYDPAIDMIGAYAHVVPESDPCANLINYVLKAETRAALIFSGSSAAERDRAGHTITELGNGEALVIGGTSSGGAALQSVTVFQSSNATVTTDKLDYQPGDTATISGTGFAAGETVRVMIHEDPHTPNERGFDAVADANGNFSGTYLVQDYDLNMKFVVGARGLTSGNTAQTTFTDSNNFAVTPLSQTVAPGSTNTFVWTFTAQNAANVQTLAFTVPAGWTAPQTGAGPGQVSVAAGTCAASLAGVSGMIITVDQGPGSGTCANNTTFTLTYANATAPSPPSTTGYTFSNQHGQSPTVTVTGDTTAPTVTINQAVGQNDPTNASPINFTVVFSEPTTNFVTGDVTISGTAGATTQLVTGSGTTYNVAVSGMTTNGTVIASIAANRATDVAGNPNTASTSTDNTVTYDAAPPTVSSINRVNASPTNANSIAWNVTFNESVSGVTANDFVLTNTGISGALFTLVTGSGANYTVTTSTGNGSGTIGLNLNDNDSIVDAAGNTLGGTGTGVAGGGEAGNGSFTGQVYTIDRTLTPVIVADDKVYDGNTTATLSSCTYTSALPVSEDVNVLCTSPTFDDPNVGARMVTANVSLTGTAASKYVLASPTASDTAAITQAPSVTAVSCPPGPFTYTGSAIEPCSVTVTGAGGLNLTPTPTYANNVSAGTATASYNFAGDANHTGSSDSENFTIGQASSLTTVSCPTSVPYNSLAQEPCTFTVTGANLNIGPSPLATTDYSANENVGTATASYTFAGDANHTGSSGSDTFDITAIALTINGAVAQSKVYNGDNVAVVNFSGATLATPIAGDAVTINSLGYSATFNDENYGIGKPVTVIGVVLAGADASNYTVSQPVGLTADITKLNLTVADAIAFSKDYDGFDFALVDFSGASLVTPVGTDDVTLDESGYAATFNNANAGTNKPVTVTGLALAGADAGNYTLTQPTLAADIIPVELTATIIGNPTKVYDGDASATLAAANFQINGLVGTEGFTVTKTTGSYDSANAGPRTVSTSLIAADLSPNGPTLASNYVLPTSASGPGTITKAPTTTTVTFEAGPYVYRGTAFTATANVTGAGGLSQAVTPVNYTGDCTNVTSANGCSASATYAESANHFSSNDSKSITITPATPTVTVTFGASPITYDGNPHPASVTVNGVSGALAIPTNGTTAISYTKDAAPFVGTPTDAGAYTASASFTSANANYTNASSAADALLTIDKASSTTIITCPTNVTYTGSAHEPCTATATGAGGLNVSVTVTYINNVNAGTALADSTYAGDANHNGSTATQASFIIYKAATTTTVTCGAGPFVYTGSPITPCTATVTGPALNQSLTAGYTDNVNAGTATASASYAESANYLGSNDSETFTIEQASSTTTVTCPTSAVYTGAAIEPCIVSVTGANLNLTPAPTYADNVNVGTATASYTYAGDANHTGSSGSDTFDITHAPTATVIDCSPGSFVYTGSAITPCTATVTGASLATTTAVSYGSNVNVGTATADASYPGDANHSASTATQVTFAITPAPTTTVIDCSPGTFVYTGSPIEPCTANVTGANLVTTTAVIYGNNTNVGTATADASYPGDANHSTSTATQVTFAITPASTTTTVTCTPDSLVYTGSPLTPCTVSVTGASLSLTPTPTYADNVDVGTATASYDYPGDANHTGSSGSDTFEITQASSTTTITCPPSVTYTGSPLEPCAATATGAGGLNASVAIVYANNTNAGTATADATYAGDANHTGSTAAQVSFTISQAASTTSVTCPASVTYNGSAQTPCTANVTGAGGLNQALTVSYTNNTNAGTANAGASYGGDANHEPSNDSETFTIDKAPTATTVTFEAGPYVYRGSAFTATANVTGAGGLNQSVTPVNYTGDCTNVTVLNGCTASATYAESANHLSSTDSKSITITKKPVAIRASSHTIAFGSPVPTITPAYEFLVAGQNSSVIDTPPSCSTTYVSGSVIGSYPTSCTGGSDNNYSFSSYLPGTVTVTTIYCFNGFHSPVGGSVESGNGGSFADPVRAFKLNSTIPFKFTLYSVGCSGSPIVTGVHMLQLQKYSSATSDPDPPIDASPTDAATTGSQFRLTGTEWHFNLDTKKTPGITAGTWLVKATLMDGSVKTVWISIKK